jgi:hypothetical protein
MPKKQLHAVAKYADYRSAANECEFAECSATAAWRASR